MVTTPSINLGNIIETRNGNLYAHMYNPTSSNYFVSIEDGEVIQYSAYDSEYIHKTDHDLDVIRVYKLDNREFIWRILTHDVDVDDYIYGDGDFDDDEVELVWARAKKMTVAEISKALGYEVEVIKEGGR